MRRSGPLLVAGVSAGRDGDRVRAEALAGWRRTLPLNLVTEDIPRAERRVTLAAKRDAFGLPLNSIAYPPSTRYELDGIEHVLSEVRRRLAPLGVRTIEAASGPRGGHLLGTCRMGSGEDAVVDAELRHLDFDNLFVAGGSAFPTYGPVNPTLTIAALSLRLGNLLAGETR